MKPCRTCGGVDRTKSGRCKPCKAKSQAKYVVNNKDKILAYKLKNKDKIAAYHKARYAASPQEKIARENKRRLDNPEKFRKYHIEYRGKNKEVIAKRLAKFYKENAIALKARTRKRYWDNPEPAKIMARKWAKDNPELCRIRGANRRAKLKSTGTLSKGLIEKLFKLQRGRCACCGKPLGNNYHLDHIMPLALSGANEDCNMQLLTAFCNLQKHAKHPIDFMQGRGFLI